MEREKKTSLKKRNTLTKLFLRKSKTLIKQQPQPAALVTNQIHLCPLPVESAGLFHASADESSDQEHPISPVKEAPVIVTCKEKLTNLMTDINNTKSEYFKSSTEEEDETTLQLPHLQEFQKTLQDLESFWCARLDLVYPSYYSGRFSTLTMDDDDTVMTTGDTDYHKHIQEKYYDCSQSIVTRID